MKYCTHCGNELIDDAVVCTKCGCPTELYASKPASNCKAELNPMCLVGFILSFVFNVVGLILSIIGYNQVKNTDDNSSKTLAKAGIIISSISLGLVVVAVGFYIIFILFLFAAWPVI